jgi:NAD(P)-dependent dehydrogenase (short-subunit alcohol dehydrogenase family)
MSLEPEFTQLLLFSASGLGEATARELIKRGANVAVSKDFSLVPTKNCKADKIIRYIADLRFKRRGSVSNSSVA